MANNGSFTELKSVHSRSVFCADSGYAFRFSLGNKVFEKFAYLSIFKFKISCSILFKF